MKELKILLGIFMVMFFAFYSIDQIYADTPIGWNESESSTFDYWSDTFSIQPDNIESMAMNITYSADEEYREEFPLEINKNIYGINISGSIQLHSETSLIRIILVDNDLYEHLVYETYPLIVNTNSYSITNVCEETCFLETITPQSLKIELINAAIEIDELTVLYSPVALTRGLPETQKQIKETQNTARINAINNQIKEKGLKWTAGETSVSQLPYAEKKRMFSLLEDNILNTHGFEYYKGGIFEKLQDTLDTSRSIEDEIESLDESSLVESFDWRNRHGANDPGSPYYDGDPTGSGWITPVKRQGCRDCWSFSAVHATEAIVNLYFNQHIDLDLSEQQVTSCSYSYHDSCVPGTTYSALQYIIGTGVVDEECFPYSSGWEPCTNKCLSPNEQIRISGKLYPGSSEEEIKRAVISYGPITAGIISWFHFMVLVGFDIDHSDGETIWIFKNSFGTGWGDNGYGYVKVDLSDLYGKYALLTPIDSLITPYEIACDDKDGDGYYNWGISKDKPPSCPSDALMEKDCDDSDASLGPFDSNGNCVEIEITNINDYVTFEPDPSTYSFTTDTTGCDKIGYSLNILATPDTPTHYGSKNVPPFTLTNNSSQASIDSFYFTIGDTTRNFDFVEVTDDGGIDFALIAPNLLEAEDTVEDFRSDNLNFIFSEGFGPNEVFKFSADVDIDNGNSREDFTQVFFNNSDESNSVITVGFSTGDFLSLELPESPSVVPGTDIYRFIQGPPPGEFAGKYNFDAALTNISEETLSNLFIEVDELTNSNLLLTDNGLIGEGERFAVLNSDDYYDHILSPNEYLDVPFTICLNNRDPFSFFVDVYGKSETRRAPVEKTGQIHSYGEGDDGDLQKGVPWPIPRFTDNGDGTIKDNLTYLIWDKNANRFGEIGWSQALIACNQLAENGVDLTDGSVEGDWYLANRFELESILHMGFHNPSLPNTQGIDHWTEGDPFINVDAGEDSAYWTSTTHALATNNAWTVYINTVYAYVDHPTLDSEVSTMDKDRLLESMRAWCVRSEDLENSKPAAPVQKTGQTKSYAEGDDGDLLKGVTWPNPRFTDNGDGTIKDNLTHLIWDKNANRFGTRGWEDALTACNQLADNGSDLTDGSTVGEWHLANRFELESILHMGAIDIAVPDTDGNGQWGDGDPFINLPLTFDLNYWTSSSVRLERYSDYDPPFIKGYANVVNLTSGSVTEALTWSQYVGLGVDLPPSPSDEFHYVWCVREDSP